MSKPRVVLAMSGGVDSSVSAHLLLEAGYNVIGLFMRTGASHDGGSAASCDSKPVGAAVPARRSRGCCSALDAGDAERVAFDLGIPFYALNFEEDFRRIQDYFAEEYLAARTPNPCVVCNTWLKFGKLWDYAQAVEADWIATGHYARVTREGPHAQLHQARDETKDQTYFLFGIARAMLDRILFPLGDWTKPEVRQVASQLGLEVHSKPDSQEICFVPDGNHLAFIESHRPGAAARAGVMVDTAGNVVGTHEGIAKYTIGQRKGLGIAFGTPRYVVGLDAATNQVIVGEQALLRKNELHADRVNWLIDPPAEPIRCRVRIRHVHHAALATATPIDGNRVHILFDEPQTAITPGQAAVLYRDTQVLGGGWIT